MIAVPEHDEPPAAPDTAAGAPGRDRDTPRTIGDVVLHRDGPGDQQQALKELLEGFLRGYTTLKTRLAYARDLGIPPAWIPGHTPPPSDGPRRGRKPGPPSPLAWLPWCLSRRLTLPAVRPRDVEQWLDELVEHGYSRDTRGRMLSAVSAFHRYLIREERAETNPAAVIDRRNLHLNRRTSEPSKTKRWTFEQCRALLEAAWLLAPHTRNGLRDRAMTEVLVGVGPRADELVGLNLGDYRREQPGGRGELTVHGKGGKDRLLGVPPAVCDAIEDYLAVREAPDVPAVLGQVGHRAAPMFISRTGARLHVSHVTAMLRQLVVAFVPAKPPRARWHLELLATNRATAIAEQLRPLAGTIHPHSNRHSYGTHAVERGVPVRQVQLDLGHEDPRTTERYLHDAHSTASSGAHALEDALHRGWWTPRSTAEAVRAYEQQHPGQPVLGEPTGSAADGGVRRG